MTETQVDITVVIGTTPEGRKVHMAWKRNGQVLCESGPAISNVIAELPEEGGQDQTMAVLDEHTIAVSLLCAHCFTIRFRSRLTARRKKI